MFKIITYVAITTLLSSCALERHHTSGYSGGGAISGPAHSSQLGASTQAGANVSTRDSDNLKNLESQLRSEQEKKQYYHYKPLLKTDAQRTEFLNRPDMKSRNAYAKSQLFPVEKRDFSTEELNMISKRDIAVGMSRRAVEESWGNPLERMPAGNALRGNELWVYKKLVPTSNGYKTEMRHVYFESGHVAGWETKQ